MATAGGGDDLADVGPKPGHETKKLGGQIQCVVVSPERTVLDELCDFVALPLFDGELGVLPGRAPLIGRLGYGELRTRTGTLVNRYFVDGGFAQVRADVVTVLTASATPVGDINTVAATEALEAARGRRATTDDAQADKSRSIARARAQLRLAGHRG